MLESNSDTNSPWQVFLIFLRLGCSSFGGPIAHLGYFRNEFVTRRRWLSNSSYADLIALCQFLPGPASSQVGLALGMIRCGYGGALAAWAGFTLPSAFLLIVLAIGITGSAFEMHPGVVQGLKIVAVAVVTQAVWGMAKSYCTDLIKSALTLAACVYLLLMPGIAGQLSLIVLAGCIGLLVFKPKQIKRGQQLAIGISHQSSVIFFTVFVGLLVGLPILANLVSVGSVQLIDSLYRSGALVFGGGHVVLPLLQSAIAEPGWLDNDVFLAGYGAAQAVPGPLFTFGGFLGAAVVVGPGGIGGGLIGLMAIFLPAVLLVFACLPHWERMRRNQQMQAALTGINAAVVGLLAAALYDPIGISTITQPLDVILILIALIALQVFKLPSYLVVICSAVAGRILFA